MDNIHVLCFDLLSDLIRLFPLKMYLIVAMFVSTEYFHSQ